MALHIPKFFRESNVIEKMFFGPENSGSNLKVYKKIFIRFFKNGRRSKNIFVLLKKSLKATNF